MRVTLFLSAICLIFSLTGCTSGQDVERRLQSLQRKVDSLETQLWSEEANSSFVPDILANVNGRITDLESRIWSVEYEQNSDKSAFFNATDPKGYQVLQTATGQFLVSLDEAIPYLDGYRLRFEIGNPYSATFHGMVLKVKWGKNFRAFSKTKTINWYDKWKQSLREKESTILQDLQSGTWNIVSVVVSPAAPDELSHIELSMTTQSVSMIKK